MILDSLATKQMMDSLDIVQKDMELKTQNMELETQNALLEKQKARGSATTQISVRKCMHISWQVPEVGGLRFWTVL
jgi:hypothetical protein